MGYRALFNENRELKTQLALLRDVLENIGSCVYAKDLDESPRGDSYLQRRLPCGITMDNLSVSAES